MAVKSHALILVGLLMLTLAGCHIASYPEDEIVSSIQEICRKEYGVENVEVKMIGKTIGVFLPLQKLFTADVRHLVMSGQVENLESLFEPEPEAMDKLEDVLFTISRVMLSTDKEIDFYVLKAVDVKGTGLQLVLKGYIPDVRRVRLWDIPRSEYRKRVIHELKLNRTILWEEPVRAVFDAVERGNIDEVVDRYFLRPPSPPTASLIFYEFLNTLDEKQNTKIEILDIRSFPYANVQALVYVKLRETFEERPGVSVSSVPYPSGSELEYIFVVKPGENEFKIVQIISFYYLDEMNMLRKTSFPPELQLYQNLESWSERFEIEEIFLGEFLALQLNRRAQWRLVADERVRLTIEHARINFAFVGAREDERDITEVPHFQLYFNFLTRSMKDTPSMIDQVLDDEDVLYIFELMLREFMHVVHGYRFTDFDGIDLIWEPANPTQSVRLTNDQLERFDRRKMSIAQLIGSTSDLPIR